MMTVEFVCRNCEKDILADLSKNDETVQCPNCSHKVPLNLTNNMQKGGKVDRCVICGKIRFYVQKDFNPRLGILIFAIGVIFSYHTYGLTLLIATIIDFILYKVLKTVTIFYHCRAIYRVFEEDPTHQGFDHNLAMTLIEKKPKESVEV
jgi:DNA-directed RNA polymerase subunit RPC12/RpoP